MKIIVAWDREEAGKLALQLDVEVTRLLLRKYGFVGKLFGSSEELSQQYLEFETQDFSEAKAPAESIQQILKESYGIRSFVAIQVVPGIQFRSIGDFAVEQELNANRRLKAMKDAIEALKATRSWFKDKRLAEIRRRLEQNLY